MDVYEYLLNKSKNGKVTASLSEIMKATEMNKSSVRRRLVSLYASGLVTKLSTMGDSMTSVYSIRESDEEDNVRRIRELYCERVSDRVGRDFNAAFAFKGYYDTFKKIGRMCTETDMDVELYIVACFYAFPEHWCQQTFKKKYPPPYALLNRRRATERYDAMLRYVQGMQVSAKTVDEFIVSSAKIHATLELDFETTVLFVMNGTIAIEYAVGKYGTAMVERMERRYKKTEITEFKRMVNEYEHSLDK